MGGECSWCLPCRGPGGRPPCTRLSRGPPRPPPHQSESTALAEKGPPHGQWDARKNKDKSLTGRAAKTQKLLLFW